MSKRDPQLPPPLPVNLESLKDLILFTVVFEYSAHVMEHSGDGHCNWQEGNSIRLLFQFYGTGISLCGRPAQPPQGKVTVPRDTCP
jgi:hypothetical protein